MPWIGGRWRDARRARGSAARDAYGKLLDESGETTEARAAGRWGDEETGLFCNRYRYFDPAMGRYISPDPIGLAGGENP